MPLQQNIKPYMKQHKAFAVLLALLFCCAFVFVITAEVAQAGEIDGCYFKESQLPDDAVVWVGDVWVRDFPFPGYKLTPNELAGNPAQIDVVVNNPKQSVILYLSTSNRVHLNFRWTPGTKIVAALLAGGDVTAVGLPDDVPIVYADFKHPECSMHDAPIGSDTYSLWLINKVSLAAIGRKPQKYFWSPTWRLVMGEEDYDPPTLISADAQLRQKPLEPIPVLERYKAQIKYDISIKSADDKERLEQQSQELKESLGKNHLRVVQRETMEAWVEGHIKLLEIQNLATEGTGFTWGSSAEVNGYEVSSPNFRLADVCTAKSEYHIFFPESMNASTSFFPADFNIGECSLYFGRSGYYISKGRFIKLWQLDNLGTMIITGSLPGKKWGIVLLQ